jgi:hypothetical protein
MYPAARPLSYRPAWPPLLRCCLLTCLAALPVPAAPAQERPQPAVRLGGVVPGGVRSSVTQGWTTLEFTVINPTDTDRLVRAVVFYTGHPDVQYGRDVWVPARAELRNTWLLVGPAPLLKPEPLSCEVQLLLYDREDAKGHLVLPRTEERVRSQPVAYRERKREPSTAIFLEDAPDEDGVAAEGQLPPPVTREDEAVRLVRSMRHAHPNDLSDTVKVVNFAPLPTTAQAFDGIDLFVLASGRLADDPAGLRALRYWLEHGGRVWVLLDMVPTDVLAPLLGDALDFEVVGQTSLTHFAIEERPGRNGWAPKPLVQQHDQPVEFVRVLLPPGEQAAHTVGGWPAWFTRRVGRGTVVFTTLGARGWYRDRTPRDGRSRYRNFPFLPVATPPLELVADELVPRREAPPFPPEAFRPLLTAEIGYSVLGRGTVALIFGAALAAALALGFALRRSQRRELLGWLGPLAAVGAAAVLLTLAEASRRAVPPTVAAAQVVHAVSGQREAAVHGLLAVYRPDAGPAEVGARQGGFFELDMNGLEGQSRRLITTDLDTWHWENLDLPAGVRFAPFRYTAPNAEPLAAVARFGPEGLEGRLTTGPYRDLADAILTTPDGRSLAVRLHPDGTFQAGSQDVLPAGQFLPGAVLSDRQQRRQELYRELVKPPPPEQEVRGRTQGNVLLAWATPAEMPFALAPQARRAGTALLVIPLQLERSARGERVTVPAPLIAVRRLVDDSMSMPLLREAREALDTHLRFQLPASVLPLRVERARFTAKVNAPGRRVTVSTSPRGAGPRELRRVDSPLDPIRVDITEQAALALDEGGGLHMKLSISGPPEGDTPSAGSGRWTIESIALEVVGRTEG